MKNFIISLFNPVLTWLNSIYTNLREASVPAARPIDLSQYLGIFGYLGPSWTTFITTGFLLGSIYLIVYMVVVNRGLLIKFKDLIKWW